MESKEKNENFGQKRHIQVMKYLPARHGGANNQLSFCSSYDSVGFKQKY